MTPRRRKKERTPEEVIKDLEEQIELIKVRAQAKTPKKERTPEEVIKDLEEQIELIKVGAQAKTPKKGAPLSEALADLRQRIMAAPPVFRGSASESRDMFPQALDRIVHVEGVTIKDLAAVLDRSASTLHGWLKGLAFPRDMKLVRDVCNYALALGDNSPYAETDVTQTSPPMLAIAWDPTILTPKDYVALAAALGDIVRAMGGIGIQRIADHEVEIEMGVEVGDD